MAGNLGLIQNLEKTPRIWGEFQVPAHRAHAQARQTNKFRYGRKNKEKGFWHLMETLEDLGQNSWIFQGQINKTYFFLATSQIQLSVFELNVVWIQTKPFPDSRSAMQPPQALPRPFLPLHGIPLHPSWSVP